MLELIDVSASYDDRTLFSRVSVKVELGTFTSILGPSGSGKTTLLRVLAGFRKPNGGFVKLDGSGIDLFSVTKRNQLTQFPKVGITFQDHRLFQNLTCFDNIGIGLPEDNAQKKEAIIQYSLQFGVQHCLARFPREVSLGEAQRVAIIRALVRKPAYLLMDEPTASLDDAAKENLRHALLDYQRLSGAAIVVVTHDLVFQSRAATSTWLLDSGVLRSGLKPTDFGKPFERLSQI
jgi:ABC-type Fe3+/spermidine/putrescine transport system ATPase subunit